MTDESTAADDVLWERALARAFGDDESTATPAGPADASVIAFLARQGSAPAPLSLREAIEDDEDAVVCCGDDHAVAADVERYDVIGEIARGGFGVVLKARDRELGRDVAMKVLHDARLSEPGLVARFVAEAQIAGQLQHPAIVPVYDVGLDRRNRPFFTMKLVRGRTFSALLRERTDPDRDRRRFLRVFEQVCEAIAYAHARGVVHRDLKPANVMVGAFGEVQVLDWGIAKVLAAGGVADERAAHRDRGARARDTPAADDSWDEEAVAERVATLLSGSQSKVSIAGSAMGTPAYMSPEQARGALERLDERTDVFCLGAMLCEILTGDPPHAGGDARQQFLAAGRGDLSAASARLDGCGADPELVQLAKECLEASPDRRPEQAGEVARRIGAFLASLERRARVAEVEAVEERARVAHERRAKRLAIGLGGAVVAAVLLGAGIFLTAAERERDAAELAMRDVSALLAEASEAAGRNDWAAAEDVAKRAEARAAAPAAGDDLRATVAERLAAYGEHRRRDELVERIDTIRSRDDLDLRRRGDAYETAFSSFGVDVRAAPAAVLAERLLETAGAELARVVRALDHWAVSYRIDRELRLKLLAAANRIDDDPWRQLLRAAVSEGDRDVLVRLASAADTALRPPESVVLLATALSEGDDIVAQRLAAELLRRGAEEHPGDFWMHFRLAIVATLRGHAPLPLGLRHAEIAAALRPENAQVRALLGLALVRTAQEVRPERPVDDLLARAVACFDAASARSPDDPLAALGRVHVLAVRGDVEGARAALRELLVSFPDMADRPHLIRGLPR